MDANLDIDFSKIEKATQKIIEKIGDVNNPGRRQEMNFTTKHEKIYQKVLRLEN